MKLKVQIQKDNKTYSLEKEVSTLTESLFESQAMVEDLVLVSEGRKEKYFKDAIIVV